MLRFIQVMIVLKNMIIKKKYRTIQNTKSNFEQVCSMQYGPVFYVDGGTKQTCFGAIKDYYDNNVFMQCASNCSRVENVYALVRSCSKTSSCAKTKYTIAVKLLTSKLLTSKLSTLV